MRAIAQDTYGSADVLRLARIARPEIADNEVLLRVHAAGLDRGTWHLMMGKPYGIRLGFGLRGPGAWARCGRHRRSRRVGGDQVRRG